MDSSADKPIVSIITPTLNSEKFIRDNIRSIRKQTYANIEHVIIDGGSTDNTLLIIKELNPHAVVFSEKDKGISDAFNKGIKASSGDIVAILNSDDYYADDGVIERVVGHFIAEKECKIMYGKVRCIEPDSGRTLAVYGQSFSMRNMKKTLIIPHPATFIKREAIEAAGDFALDLKVCMDYEYLLRVSTLFEPYFTNEILTIMRWGGYSTKNIYIGHREAYRIIRSNGVNRVAAVSNLVGRYLFSSVSILLQVVGLKNLLLLYRSKRDAFSR